MKKTLQDPGGAVKVSLFAHEERERKLEQLKDPLRGIEQHVDLAAIAEQLDKDCPRPSRVAGGRPPFPTVVMVRALLIQQLYHLSDEAMEFQLNDRLSFQRFCLLRDAGNMPDRTTFWTFRERIGEASAESIFESVQRELGRHGFIARKGQLVDASIIDAPKQALSSEDKAILKENATPASWSASKRRQKDRDAKWTKKHGKSDYGYKLHANADNAYKLIRRVAVSPANESDTQHFEGLLDRLNTSKDVYADKGYTDRGREQRLEAEGQIRAHIQRKAKRGQPQSAAQKRRNHRIAKTRVRVEHVFGALNAMGGKVIRSVGLRRAKASLTMKASVYNLTRLVSLKKAGVQPF